jgi:hypothetical protein
MPALAQSFGANPKTVADNYRDYHHYGNPPSVERWIELTESAGFVAVEHIPLMPELMSRACLFLDNLWHLTAAGKELGPQIQSYLADYKKFPTAMRHFMAGLFMIERNPQLCGGAVFRVRK